jgi:transposase-like protein
MTKTKQTKRSRSAKRLSLRDGMQTSTPRGGRGRAFPLEIRRAVVDEVRAGTPPEDVARAFGVSVPTALRWTTVFEQGGDPALQP